MPDLGGIEQRLGRHAAAKDAKAAHFFPAFDHGRAQARRRSRSSRGVPTAAAADNRDVVLESVTHSV